MSKKYTHTSEMTGPN